MNKFIMTNESGDVVGFGDAQTLAKSVSAFGAEPLLKAHVSDYTKKDGTHVNAHETTASAKSNDSSNGGAVTVTGSHIGSSRKYQHEFRSDGHFNDWHSKHAHDYTAEHIIPSGVFGGDVDLNHGLKGAALSDAIKINSSS